MKGHIFGHDYEITLRELLVSIVILLASIALGFIIATKLHDYITLKNDKYFTSLKVEDDEIFGYSIETEVGGMLANGEFQANEPVKDSLIDGEFFSIIKVEERYVKKTRQEAYSCGDKTCYRTVTYWEWDEFGRDKFSTETFTFLNQEFDSSIAYFNFHKGYETVKVSSNKRYVFSTIPKTFNGSMYSYAKDKTISDAEVFYERSIKEIIDAKENEAGNYTVLFWVLWIIASIIGIILFCFAENYWLHKN